MTANLGARALDDRDVHVHLVDSDAIDPDALAAARLAWLSTDERERYERYIPARSRHEYLVTRVLCRTLLARHLGVEPAALAFVLGPYGKPELRDPTLPAGVPLRFNLSNTNGLVACAITRGRDVGVDVEHLNRRTETLSVADRFFSAQETAALFALPASAQRQRFFELWTLKEAYIKARGLGLAIPLGSFSFSLQQGGHPLIGFDASLTDDPSSWWFEQSFPSEAHAMALAVREPGGTPLSSRLFWERLSP